MFLFTFITLGFTLYLHRCFYYTRVCSCFSFFWFGTPVDDAWDITSYSPTNFSGRKACEMSGTHELMFMTCIASQPSLVVVLVLDA
ncbi:hypothetical protein BDV38DRAFT_173136 [Aspergillus pseudotamarii]|uniref:Secreted protein n=1 Tax=Aspergillus pseudotamarii TaxID=132259 RepID=A0A5N6SH24_ASPPS|nr:uncharacterized protein BDV38DRAFT_173136 [Aspergillus pseudotamarii]KAE8133972.1 hypothetical protein BDV38DRAFT_173136 [Aspergillus pseudotamarii]